jgi:thiol-disulfide isomerase/thioredoxin
MISVMMAVFFTLAALLPLPASSYRPMIDHNRGVVLVVAFWATWCEPCREELPRLQTMARKSGGRIRLVTVSADEPEQAGAAESFLDHAKIGGGQFRMSGTDIISEVDPRWSGVLPAVVVYDASGVSRGMITGQMDWAKLKQLTSPGSSPGYVNHPNPQGR